jgi:hypothetical protein
MFRIDLLFCRGGELLIRFSQGRDDVGVASIEGQVFHHCSRHAELTGIDQHDPMLAAVALDALFPFAVLIEIKVKPANDTVIAGDRAKRITQIIFPLWGRVDQNQNSLICGSYVQRLTESMEVLNDRFIRVCNGGKPKSVLSHLLGARPSTEYHLRPASCVGEPLFSVRRKNTENAVLEPTVQEAADLLLMRFALVGVDADTDKFSRGVNEFFGCEQTVLRGCVARSENARDAVALCGRGYEHDRPPASLCLRQARFPCGVPGDPRFTEIELGSSKIGWPRTLAYRDATKSDHADRHPSISHSTYHAVSLSTEPSKRESCSARALVTPMQPRCFHRGFGNPGGYRKENRKQGKPTC